MKGKNDEANEKICLMNVTLNKHFFATLFLAAAVLVKDVAK